MAVLLVARYSLLLIFMTALAWVLVAYAGAPSMVFASVPSVFLAIIVLDVWRRRMAARERT
jgi:hypothetical protein